MTYKTDSPTYFVGYRPELPGTRRLFFMEGDGYTICPICKGSGEKISPITTYREVCRCCGGEGKVRSDY